jgi:hypothetical protein
MKRVHIDSGIHRRSDSNFRVKVFIVYADNKFKIINIKFLPTV